MPCIDIDALRKSSSSEADVRIKPYTKKDNFFLDTVDRFFQLVTTVFLKGFPTARKTGKRTRKLTS